MIGTRIEYLMSKAKSSDHKLDTKMSDDDNHVQGLGGVHYVGEEEDDTRLPRTIVKLISHHLSPL